jgi:hypothetical protein
LQSDFKYNTQPKFRAGSPGKIRLSARIAELSRNPLLRTDPWSLINGGISSKVCVIVGGVPMAWEGGKMIDGDSVLTGMQLWCNQATPLMQSACDNAVGARKVIMIISHTVKS